MSLQKPAEAPVIHTNNVVALRVFGVCARSGGAHPQALWTARGQVESTPVFSALQHVLESAPQSAQMLTQFGNQAQNLVFAPLFYGFHN
jgi:hypothetical protein